MVQKGGSKTDSIVERFRGSWSMVRLNLTRSLLSFQASSFLGRPRHTRRNGKATSATVLGCFSFFGNIKIKELNITIEKTSRRKPERTQANINKHTEKTSSSVLEFLFLFW